MVNCCHFILNRIRNRCHFILTQLLFFCHTSTRDYEIRINYEDRKIKTLKNYVRIIWKIITDAEDYILREYPDILLPGHSTSDVRLPKEITFLTSEELHTKYPTLSVHKRENAAVREYGAVFIIGMGWPMKDGSPPEEVRAPSYDDWNLNGDIIVMVRMPNITLSFKNDAACFVY